MIYALGSLRPVIAEDCYIAPNAQVIGQVRLERGASVWFNVVLRADSDWITIGEHTNVQDGTVMHANEGEPTHIGRGVTIGHMALVHACTVGDETLIANGAMVLDRARIGSGCVIAAGALVPPGRHIPDGSVVMGSPGRIVRQASAEDRALIRKANEIYRERAVTYRSELQSSMVVSKMSTA